MASGNGFGQSKYRIDNIKLINQVKHRQLKAITDYQLAANCSTVLNSIRPILSGLPAFLRTETRKKFRLVASKKTEFGFSRTVSCSDYAIRSTYFTCLIHWNTRAVSVIQFWSLKLRFNWRPKRLSSLELQTLNCHSKSSPADLFSRCLEVKLESLSALFDRGRLRGKIWLIATNRGISLLSSQKSLLAIHLLSLWAVSTVDFILVISLATTKE